MSYREEDCRDVEEKKVLYHTEEDFRDVVENKVLYHTERNIVMM